MEVAFSRRHPVARLTLSIVMYICFSRVWCRYTPPSQNPQDLRGSSVVSTTDGCAGSCDSITEQMCGRFGVCSLSCRSGRTTFPSQTVLTRNAECSVSQPGSLPAGVNGTNGNYFTNSSDSTTCNVNMTVSPGSAKTFSISFWIQGNCSDCTVLRVDSLTVKLRGSQLLVNSRTVSSAVTDTDFVHVVLTKRSSSMFDAYVNNTGGSVSLTTPNFQDSTLVLGPETALTGSESLLLLDGRFYDDGLTKREIEELFTGNFPLVSLESECRCPVSEPDISTDGLRCSGNSNSSRLTKTFHDIGVVLNNSASSKWVSKETGDVTIMIDLRNSVQVTEVTVTFSSNSSLPTTTEWSFESAGQKKRVEESQYTLSTTNCSIKSGTPSDYQAFSSTIAEKIEMKFIGRSPGNVANLIIESVTILGTCDCDGSATACTLTSGSSASYTCTCLNQTEGDHCRSCVNDYYRESTGFGCTERCDCDRVGRNPTRHCNTVGGECLCRSNVEGERCDTCKPLTYNFTMSNPDGCTRSSCDIRGSSSCNNETGECHCRPNVVNSNCSECDVKHYWTSQSGCLPCDCDAKGTKEASGLVCNLETGQCDCKQNVQDRKCGQCKDEYYGLSMTNPNGCSACQCHMLGTSNRTCDNGPSGQCQCRGDDFTSRTCTPSVTEVVPQFAPEIGGTEVTISGHYLINSTVTIGTIRLTASRSTDTQLIFIVPAKGLTTSPTLSVTWPPNSSLTYSFEFTYKPDPILAAENPTSVTGAQSGGCYVTLAGTNLNSVYKPRLMVNASGEESLSDCKPESSGKRMKCATPAVAGLNGSVAPVYIFFGIYPPFPRLNITIMPDAVINAGLFVEFAPPFEKTITITGKRIGTDCHSRDYSVVIGDDVDCPITSFSETSIECEPPSSPPVTTTIDKRRYKMRVFVGARDVEVGEIYYKQFWLTKYFIYIMVGCGLFIIALIALLICICVCRRRRRSSKKKMSEPLKNITPLTENNGRSVSDEHELIEPSRAYTPFPRNNKYINPGFDGSDAEEHDKDEVVNTEYFLHRVEEGIRSKVQACIIGKKNFAVGSVCYAKGNHARLIDGTFTARSKIDPMEKLTIKMLKDPLPESGVLSSLYTTALRECLRFKSYVDESLLTIKGIGLDKRRFYILYPYMENRTLKDHISDSKKNFALRQLLELAGQVCEGMDFLSSKDVVHKDLATRNCMLDAGGRVKITDAAFSWDFYPNEYMYNSQRDRYLPVRWMAPESLSTGFYDSKSDVWSFGVLMWELTTRGLLPFQDIADEKVQDSIVEGFRLGKPQTLTEDLYELMNSCWHAENEHRPSFIRIQQQITSAMTDRASMDENLYVNQQGMDNVYINTDEINQIRNNINNYR